MNYGYTILLFLLRCLVYLKRALVWLLKQLLRSVLSLEDAFQKTIGFRLYKVFFLLRRHIGRAFPKSPRGIPELFGRRGTLQAALFFVAFILMLPHTRLVAEEDMTFPGHKTVLYTLVGPGEEDFSLEEVPLDVSLGPPPPSWNAGAISPEDVIVASPPTSEISGITAGGSALTKPTILPGNAAPIGAGIARTKIVIHEVSPGEVIGGIAGRYGVRIETILSANNLTLRSRIHPGDKLKILPVDGVVHTVKRGDTVGRIARLYGAKEDDIISFNTLRSDGTDMAVGEDLIIPGGTPPPKPKPAPVRRYTALSNIAAPPPSIEAPAGYGYIWPAGVRRISQYFTLRHNGVDIAGPAGTALYAARAGAVVKSQCGWNGGYGCYIVLDHGDGYRTVYGHVSQLFVNVGDMVEQGQTIAAMGSTGRSTGPHVHFEVRYNNRNQNPLRFVR